MEKTVRSVLLGFVQGVTLACVIASVPAVATAQAKPAAVGQSKVSDPLKALSAQTDKMRGITWYQHATSPKHINSGGFYLYFGKESSGQFTSLRLVARYYADDWLFVKSAWAKADAATIEFPQESGKVMGWERDNSDGKIWEWSDVPVSKPSEIAAVRQLAEAKSVTVRF